MAAERTLDPSIEKEIREKVKQMNEASRRISFLGVLEADLRKTYFGRDEAMRSLKALSGKVREE